MLRIKGVQFTYMLKRLLYFIESETNTPTIIAHSGYTNHFPLLFINCIKHNIKVADVFKNYKFIDSLKVIKDSINCQKPGLKSISKSYNLQHNALEDVKSLVDVFTKQPPYMNAINENHQIYSTKDILQYVKHKLPLSIDKMIQLRGTVQTVKQLIKLFLLCKR